MYLSVPRQVRIAKISLANDLNFLHPEKAAGTHQASQETQENG